MLTQMCQEILTDTEIKAICKNRGFSTAASKSRQVFESFMLSNIGLESVFASLTQREIMVLHLLKQEMHPIDVSHFEQLYGNENTSNWQTFTQRYSPIFKKVKSELIRKGVLLIAQVPADTKMAAWRFHFPSEFHQFLPPQLKISIFEVDGEQQTQIIRYKIQSLIDNNQDYPQLCEAHYAISLVNQRLKIGNKDFSLAELNVWQTCCWRKAIWPSDTKKVVLAVAKQSILLTFLAQALAELKANEWVMANQLAMLLRLKFPRLALPKAELICDKGWEMGCLARYSVDGKHYYRLASNQAEQNPEIGLISGKKGLFVNLEQISYSDLALLASMTRFAMLDGQLSISPDIVRLGHLTEQMWAQPLIQWLATQDKAFQSALKVVKSKQGKTLVHQQLLIAKIQDLTLKVQIQKRFKDCDDVIELADNYIAFPSDLQAKISQIVNKSGYAVKTIKHD